NFSYSYFEDNATPTSNYFSWVNTDRKRLKLNSVQELSGDDAIIIPPYSFEYFNELVPRKMSFGKDHWGYINGANSNTMLYPEVFDNRGSLNTILDISINNRESAWPAMRGGSLKRINYPTGGYSDFEFEPNTTSVNGIDKMVGGLRVKSITTVDPVMNNNNKMEFEYTKAGMSTSSGILFSKPTYIQLLRNDWAKKTNMFAAVVSGGNGCPASFPDNSIQLREFILSDNSVRPMETTQGYHIGYGTVKVKRENNGYSRYVYNVNVPIQISWGSSMVTNYANNPGTCDANISSYPAAPIAFDPYRGDLLSETHFSNAGILVQEKAYETYYQQSNKSVFGRIVHKLGISTGPNAFYTYYGYKTARKGQTTIIEKNFDPNGTFIQNTTQTLFESPFHNEPTTTVSYNSFGDTLMKKNRYAFDIRSTQFDTTNNCNNASADFLSFVDQIFYSSGYNAQFANLNGNFSSYLALMNSFNQAVFNPRKALTQCTLSGIDSYQPKHDLVKGNADVNLKPIMWMQDIYKNALLETSEWKNDKLLRSVFVQHANERDDDFGVYPVKLKKIELLNTSASFTPVATASNNTGLNIDTRYNELTTINYLKGNPNNQLGRDGVNTAYDWNYNNQSPIVKVVNAYNLRRESSEIGIINKSIKFTLGSSFSNTGSAEVSFYHLGNADINFSLGTTPPGAKVTALYILTGPTQNAVQYNLCSGNGSAPSCNNISSSATLTNMPAGLYTLSINVSTTFDSYQFSNYPANYSYLGKSIITIGTKEYFYEGFEDALIPNSGLAYTGTKSYNGTYVLNFVPPNNRNYILQWWNYANGKWNFNQQPYTGTTSISGIIDEIRIFPEDAQMTTYAYDSRYGLIGICDMNNRITSYEYDRLGRLKLVRDQDGNIVKTIDYNYKN
ncbi:MAG: hypothetical protein K2X37_07860, partial [Chitinophagaceae bacterium]|nr:hypothetical protein [Chitinophagaceae bacterium]